MKIALAALAISVISLLATLILGVKNYKKSKQLEFFQRRDHLFDKISELSTRNSEARFFSARYEIVRLKKLSLVIVGSDKEETEKQCASIEAIIETLEQKIKQRTDVFESLYPRYEHLSPKDPSLVEDLIALVQVVSDSIKHINDAHLATLYALEENLPLMKENLTEINKLKIRQAELELERAIKEFELTKNGES
jgi:hypothetical protein